ncbi:MAG: SDR family oxidoreductase [Spirochaetia bacterium]|jgi:NAD(P)-dependent dehydrogenase (short-subunit alcohol dehydrogenase family)
MKKQSATRTALITGAAGGIGKAVAARFAAEGISVALVDISAIDLARFKEELPSGTEAVVRAYQIDVRDSRQVVDCVRSVSSAFNGIDYLVNCAGISTSHLIVDVNEDEWDKVFAINIKGVFLFSKEVAKEMILKEKKNGRIVNISSQASKIGELGNGAYSASKAAVNSFTQVLGLELAQYGISVTAICPGYVDTEMMRKVFQERGPIEGMTPQEYERKLVSTVPLGRMVQPDEIAGLVSYLCSKEAELITGVTVTMAGGKTLI